MSSQKGNVSRSRGQKHQNTFAFRNDKYGANVQVKKAKSKIHDGLCQRCKEVLEWRVKYNKYKSLTQPKKCVKCSQKTVKDAYHIICKTCSLQLDICAKCGKKEEIVIPINSQKEDENEQVEDGPQKNHVDGCQRKKDLDDLDTDDDDDNFGSDDNFSDNDEDGRDSRPKKTLTQSKIAVLPDVSGASIGD